MIPFLFLTFLIPISAASQTGMITARTSHAVIRDGQGGYGFSMTEKDYEVMGKRLSKYPDFAGIRKKPEKLSAGARYGFNFVVQSRNTSWILDGDKRSGYTLYLDLNADGDLTNDKPIRIRAEGGRFVHVVQKDLAAVIAGRKRQYPFIARVEITEEVPNGKTELEPVLRIQDATTRQGVLDVAGRKIGFSVSGASGLYDHETNNLYFDLDSDGKFDTETRYSLEAYKVGEKYVNISDKSYEYSVDSFGDSITLKPLAEKKPDRVDLRVGNLAPDFTYKDIDGKPRKLSDLRGKIVLVDVWALWCAPCVAEAPKLAAAYKRLQAKGFEIVSFDKDDEVESLKKFIAKYEMNWTHSQTNEEFIRLYRIDRYPTYFLLDTSGKIVSNTLRPGEEMYKEVENMLARRTENQEQFSRIAQPANPK
jgi:thiol-disulfide isomerase/thioredoxin